MTKPKSRIVTFIAASVLIIGLVQLWQAIAIYTGSLIAISYGANLIQLLIRTVLTLLWAGIWVWQAFQLYRHRQSRPTLTPLTGVIILYTFYRTILSFYSPSMIDQHRLSALLLIAGCSVAGGLIFHRQLSK